MAGEPDTPRRSRSRSTRARSSTRSSSIGSGSCTIPTQVNRQGWDVGTQYRSAIFAHSPEQARVAQESLERAQSGFRKPIATQIVTDETPFWPAEEYHQQYLVKNGRASCAI